ncbi:MAG TPA: hypothetical protein DEP87_00780 [Candidatus Pacebacteria bacterium]|nr:hypothetical protein [Candidatus Paceibacterota bacterium]
MILIIVAAINLMVSWFGPKTVMENQQWRQGMIRTNSSQILTQVKFGQNKLGIETQSQFTVTPVAGQSGATSGAASGVDTHYILGARAVPN